jgi:hypothetical protein
MAYLFATQPLVRLFINDQEVPVQSIDIQTQQTMFGHEVEVRAVARTDMSILKQPKTPSADIAKELKAIQDDLG